MVASAQKKKRISVLLHTVLGYKRFLICVEAVARCRKENKTALAAFLFAYARHKEKS